MNHYRHDSWTRHDDDLLASTVIDYIRMGKTQLSAFKGVAYQLSRTPAACGYRWNARTRQFYKKEIQEAKQDKKLKKVNNIEDKFNLGIGEDNLEQTILLLEKLKGNSFTYHTQGQSQQIEELRHENKILKDKLRYYTQFERELIRFLGHIEQDKIQL